MVEHIISWSSRQKVLSSLKSSDHCARHNSAGQHYIPVTIVSFRYRQVNRYIRQKARKQGNKVCTAWPERLNSPSKVNGPSIDESRVSWIKYAKLHGVMLSVADDAFVFGQRRAAMAFTEGFGKFCRVVVMHPLHSQPRCVSYHYKTRRLVCPIKF